MSRTTNRLSRAIQAYDDDREFFLSNGMRKNSQKFYIPHLPCQILMEPLQEMIHRCSGSRAYLAVASYEPQAPITAMTASSWPNKHKQRAKADWAGRHRERSTQRSPGPPRWAYTLHTTALGCPRFSRWSSRSTCSSLVCLAPLFCPHTPTELPHNLQAPERHSMLASSSKRQVRMLGRRPVSVSA